MKFTPALIASVLSLASFCGAGMAETVRFPGKDLTLTGELFLPSGSGPHPAVVALHGCSGLYGKSGRLAPRHADWAERLAAQGFIVLFPDSFGSRGAEAQCRTEDRVARPSRERVDDALAAKAFLQARPDVKKSAVSLLGWSNGGSTVLYTVRKGRSRGEAESDFAAAIAFYPGCRTPLEGGRWQARLKLLILIGAADDWTPAAPCRELADTAAKAGEPVSIVVYPGAYHDFDHPNLPIHEQRGLAYTGDGRGRAHTGTDPTARADAIKRVPAFLAR